jgi:hypothetical protein
MLVVSSIWDMIMKKKTISRLIVERLAKEEKKKNPGSGEQRALPASFAQCPSGPCPYVTCKYHLYLDITFDGGIRLNFPEIEPTDMMFPCALRFAANLGEHSFDELSRYVNTKPNMLRNVFAKALRKLKEEGIEDLYIDNGLDESENVLKDAIQLAKQEVA